jgi:hypothetical protein
MFLPSTHRPQCIHCCRYRTDAKAVGRMLRLQFIKVKSFKKNIFLVPRSELDRFKIELSQILSLMLRFKNVSKQILQFLKCLKLPEK